MGGHTKTDTDCGEHGGITVLQGESTGHGGRRQRGLTCLKSQPALVTGVLRFRFMECERLPKAMALRDVRVA